MQTQVRAKAIQKEVRKKFGSSSTNVGKHMDNHLTDLTKAGIIKLETLVMRQRASTYEDTLKQIDQRVLDSTLWTWVDCEANLMLLMDMVASLKDQVFF